jgi:hypothetical protein
MHVMEGASLGVLAAGVWFSVWLFGRWPDLQKRRDRSDEGGDSIKDSNSNSNGLYI